MPSRATAGAPTPARGSKLTIGFGLVNVGVKYAPLVPTGTGRAAAKTCCRTHQAPVTTEYRCTDGGELVDRDDKVMLYEVDGRFVEVDTESIGIERDGRLELTAVVDVDAIDPLYYEKPYVLWPEKGQEQGFDLIAAILRTSGRAVVGTTVMGKATRVIVLRWSQLTGTLVAHSCIYDERVSWTDVALVREAADARPALPEQLLATAEALLASLVADGFDFADVSDEYAIALAEAIELAASGRKPKAKAQPKPKEEGDLMEALRASIATVQAGGKLDDSGSEIVKRGGRVTVQEIPKSRKPRRPKVAA